MKRHDENHERPLGPDGRERPLPADDPRVSAFVLGELEGDELVRFVAELDERPDLAAEVESFRGLGEVLSKRGRYAEAGAAYARAAELAPELVEAAYGQGLAAARAGDLQRAVAHFARAAELDPARAQTHTNLGVAYVKLGQLEKAAAAYARVVELEPENGRAHRYLSEVYGRLGRDEEGRRHWEIAARLAQTPGP